MAVHVLLGDALGGGSEGSLGAEDEGGPAGLASVQVSRLGVGEKFTYYKLLAKGARRRSHRRSAVQPLNRMG